MVSWKDLKHITKLDPDKKNSKQLVKTAIESNTDALMISGTQGITKANVIHLYKQLLDVTDKPILVEPVHKSSLIYEADFIYIPIVLNSKSAKWMQGLHLDWLQDLIKKSVELPWDRVVTEGYIILNPSSTVSRVTQANTDLSMDEISSFALYGQLLGLDSIYLEYSGRFGDVEVVKHVKNFVTQSRLFYGGGIESRQQALQMLDHSNTIFVGNIIYKDLHAFIDTIP